MKRHPWTLTIASALLGVGLGVTAISSRAQTIQQEPDYAGMALKWARDTAPGSLPSGAALRLEVSVGALDNRLKLAPCGNIEPYLPPGSRLWGRSRVGLRCVDGMTRWNVTLPVTVRALGQAWVIKGQIAPNAPVTSADVVQAEVDWAEDPNPILSDIGQWQGQSATRLLGTGQALRQGMVKPAQVFQAGSQVRVIAQGPGFRISGEAQALSAGVVGQPARVKMENGRIASGVVLDARTVKIEI